MVNETLIHNSHNCLRATATPRNMNKRSNRRLKPLYDWPSERLETRNVNVNVNVNVKTA